ncbi:MAG: hypothetical protein PHG74_08455 [Kiritimatiellae bacterium]|nr:hypothetical protein [Kiritimatiellia bacterium]MDD3584032.1 hypothetical protein [Kiritimatiellia bacterium]
MTPSTSPFWLMKPSASLDHSRMCNGVIRRPPLSQATARQALYPLPISPVHAREN